MAERFRAVLYHRGTLIQSVLQRLSAFDVKKEDNSLLSPTCRYRFFQLPHYFFLYAYLVRSMAWPLAARAVVASLYVLALYICSAETLKVSTYTKAIVMPRVGLSMRWTAPRLSAYTMESEQCWEPSLKLTHL